MVHEACVNKLRGYVPALVEGWQLLYVAGKPKDDPTHMLEWRLITMVQALRQWCVGWLTMLLDEWASHLARVFVGFALVWPTTGDTFVFSC